MLIKMENVTKDLIGRLRQYVDYLDTEIDKEKVLADEESLQGSIASDQRRAAYEK